MTPCTNIGIRWIAGLALVLGVLLSPRLGLSQDDQRGPLLLAQAGAPSDTSGWAGPPDAWQFRLAPLYLWAPSVDADVTAGGVTRSFDASFGDIAENLSFAFSAHFEASHGPWTVLGDLLYMHLDKDATRTTPVGGVPRSLELDTLFFEFGGTYRLVTVPLGTVARLSVEPLWGARLVYVNTKLEGVAGARSDDRTLIDPIIGGRLGLHFGERITLWVRGDVGGFGISSSQSTLTWNLIAGADYRFVRWGSVFAGYRVMDIELEGESGHVATDLQMSGPILGLNLYF